MNTAILVLLGFLGLCLGSFVNAAVWRIRNKRDLVNDRSECVHCHHKLSWLDLVPVLSWLALKGRCRYCHKPISAQYPLVELAVAAYFVLSYLLWPVALGGWYQVTQFIIWLIYGVGLAILFVYDLRWMLLPFRVVNPLIAVAAVSALLRVTVGEDHTWLTGALSIAFSLLPVAGVYYILRAVNDNWVGGGDVRFGIFVGLAIGWEGALVTLMLANLLGCLVVLPGLWTKKLSRSSHVPFGPFLIVAFVIAGLYADRLVGWYIGGLFPG